MFLFLSSSSVFITAVSLQAQNAPKERSIDLSITWKGPTELLHGIFQGYEIFYQDTNLGKEFNVTLRTSDAFYEIRDLQHYTKYMITGRSFTLEGEGRMSEPIYVWTAPTGTFNNLLLLPDRQYKKAKYVDIGIFHSVSKTLSPFNQFFIVVNSSSFERLGFVPGFMSLLGGNP